MPLKVGKIAKFDLMKNPVCFLIFLFLSLSSLAQNTVGLISYQEGVYEGYTLINPQNYTKTYLIDNCGSIINEWESEYPSGLVAYLLEDGSLLRAARIPGSFNGGGAGGRVERFSWDGALTWSYNFSNAFYHSHHDVEFLPNGNILILAWEARTKEEAIENGRDPEFINNDGLWSEIVQEIKPIGENEIEVIWEWKVWDHLVQDFDPTKINYGNVSESPHKININYPDLQNHPVDWLHCNSVDFNPELNQVMLSCRNYNELWVFSRDSLHESNGDLLYRWGNKAAYNQGTESDQQLSGQHDAHWIESGNPGAGNIMIFNNNLFQTNANSSFVVEIVPPINENNSYNLKEDNSFGPDTSQWTYPQNPEDYFFSARISGSQRLPNGNTLICAGRGGNIFEVDREGILLWDYISPVNANGPLSQGSNVFGNDIFRAYKYAPDFSAFDDKDLIPQSQIESNGILDPDCTPFTSSIVEQINDKIKVYPNPSTDFIWIENNSKSDLIARIFDFSGKLIQENNLNSSFKFRFAKDNSSLLFLQILNTRGEQVLIKKLFNTRI